MSETYDLAIVGAGASGMAAAIAAGRALDGSPRPFGPPPSRTRGACENRILLLERMPRTGKKLLATGNGRCNLGNRHAGGHEYHNKAFAAPALERFGPAACEAFFDSLGLAIYEDAEGRLYPRGNTAACVLDALRFGVLRAGAEIRCDCPVGGIARMPEGFLLNGVIRARRVILAAGGCAVPAQGSDGSGFALLRALGHSIVEPRPALVPITVQSPLLPMLRGLRVRGSIAIEDDGPGNSEATEPRRRRRAQGEILFAQDGLSGIAAMEVSREARAGTQAVLDLLPEYSLEEITARLQAWERACPGASFAQLLAGFLPKRVGEAVLQAIKALLAGEGGSRRLGEAERIAKMCKRLTFPVTGTRGFAHAQVTAGGADVREFDSHTMESRVAPGLYACGEALDVDGGCGGFNLHWAWASGVTAGEAVVDK